MPSHPPEPHDLGLAHDLQMLTQAQARRRRALRWLAGLGAVGAIPLIGSGGEDTMASTGSSDTTTTGSTTTANAGSCSAVPEETAGPFPGDGSNTSGGGTSNVLALSGIVRSDIRSSIAGASGTADGVPLTLTVTLADSNSSSCASLAGYAIYLWHCDRDGRYSLYSAGVTGQNYLRGVQETDASGSVTFTTIFPACYAGRMPHMHFEVYRSLATASGYAERLKTSQLAFPREVCAEVYAAASGYGGSVSTLNAISFATDNVFSDGSALQMTRLSGSVTAGYSGEITVAIPA